MNPFDEVYEGTPPWDIGRPQPEIVGLAKSGAIRGIILDVGCGTGENALHLAETGHEVWGVDSSPVAIAKAKQKALERGVAVTFLVWDAFDLQGLEMSFDTIVDSGLFHIFSDEERPPFLRSLAGALRPGGRYVMLCFSDREPEDWGGPRRLSREEIHATFADGWKVEYVRDARFETNFHPDGGRAFLTSVVRVDETSESRGIRSV